MIATTHLTRVRTNASLKSLAEAARLDASNADAAYQKHAGIEVVWNRKADHQHQSRELWRVRQYLHTLAFHLERHAGTDA